MTRHTFNLSFEEINSLRTLGDSIKILLARLTCDLQSPEMRGRKLVEVSLDTPSDGDSGFIMTYYTERIQSAPSPAFDPNEYRGAFTFRAVADAVGSDPPIYIDPVGRGPRRRPARPLEYTDPYGQCVVPALAPIPSDWIEYPLPESVTNDRGQCVPSPA